MFCHCSIPRRRFCPPYKKKEPFLSCTQCIWQILLLVTWLLTVGYCEGQNCWLTELWLITLSSLCPQRSSWASSSMSSEPLSPAVSPVYFAQGLVAAQWGIFPFLFFYRELGKLAILVTIFTRRQSCMRITTCHLPKTFLQVGTHTVTHKSSLYFLVLNQTKICLRVGNRNNSVRLRGRSN